MKTLKGIGRIALIVLAVVSFLYLNYCPESASAAELSFSPEMTDVKISKFIVESLKKVAFSSF